MWSPHWGIAPDAIPSKLEGQAFGRDVELDGQERHTLFLTNDNDFLTYVSIPGGGAPNPNCILVFGFTDGDLPLPGKVERQRLQADAR
jgi:hypothetical protein